MGLEHSEPVRTAPSPGGRMMAGRGKGQLDQMQGFYRHGLGIAEPASLVSGGHGGYCSAVMGCPG